MKPKTLGIDPAKGHTGLCAVALPGGAPTHWTSIRNLTEDQSGAAQLYAALEPLRDHVWRIEGRPTRLKRHQHGSHNSGAGPAWVSGVVLGIAATLGVDVEVVPNGVAMRRMLAIPLAGGEVVDADNGRVIVHRCGHAPQPAPLARAGGSYSCPDCYSMSHAKDGRDWRKLRSCLAAERLHPEAFAAMAAPARSRSRRVAANAAILLSELAGVADACDAYWIATAPTPTKSPRRP